MDKTKISRIALDIIRGRVPEEYELSTSENMIKALVHMNGGSNKINPKTFRPGNALFELVQEIIPAAIDEGIQDDSEMMRLVEYRNISSGDTNEFITEGKATFIVSDAAAGVRGVRRQRLDGGETVQVKTSVKAVRVYEGLNRLLSGRADFNTVINGVAASFVRQIKEDALKCLYGVSASTAGLNSTYVVTGTFDEDDLLELIEHVEAETGKTAHIVGTKTALRKITTATVSDEAKSDMYEIGYYGKFNGTDMIAVKQIHKAGTSTFALDNSKVFVVAGDERPIKVVNAGDGLLSERQAVDNADLTQEYVYIQETGTGAVFSDVIGVYTFE